METSFGREFPKITAECGLYGWLMRLYPHRLLTYVLYQLAFYLTDNVIPPHPRQEQRSNKEDTGTQVGIMHCQRT
jgi:hypothetical protein